MSKDKKQKDGLVHNMKEINEDLTKLSHETNLNIILANYTEAQNKITATEKLIKDIRDDFEAVCGKEITSSKVLTDDDYLEYIKTVEQEINDFENYQLEKQIEKFEKLCKKLACCKNYLESKKMNIIKCDDIPEESENSSDS